MSSRNKKWSRLVKDRDDYTCQKCGLTFKETALESHHIIKRKNASKISDGVTLCKWCHLLADIGKSAFHKWKEHGSEFPDVLIDYINNDNGGRDAELINFINNTPKHMLKKLLGELSILERKLNTKRACDGKKASMKLGKGVG